MPWEKTFDTDEVLGKAMQAFWARGYEATSIQDLLDTMGLNRGSLYATFGDKRSLFIRALRHYDAVHRRAWVVALAQRGSPREAITGAPVMSAGTLKTGACRCERSSSRLHISAILTLFSIASG